MYKKLQRIQLIISDLADKNQCYGKLDDGMSVFVQGTIAVGDHVEAEIIKIKKQYLVARLTEVLSPAPTRIEPVCSYFGTCGGCKWQHMNYPEQLRLKQKQVSDALHHIGGFNTVNCKPCIPANEIYHYRNKVDFSFTDLRYLTLEEMQQPPETLEKPVDFALGFHAPGRFAKAIDIDTCHLATAEMNKVLNLTREFCLQHREKLPIYSTHTHTGELRNLVVRHAGHTRELMVNLVTTTHQPALMQSLANHLNHALGTALTTFVNSTTSAKNTVAFGEKEFVMHGAGYISDRLGAYTYRISPNSFFQTNTAQAEILYQQILTSAQLQPEDVVYDLFCGTGSITLFASGHCQKVLGIELVESSVHDARANAERNQIENCSFLQLDMKNIRSISDQLDAFGKPRVVITDPPRAGMHPNAIQLLRELAPPVIIYVSCNPASLARDGATLAENNLYQLTECIPIDLFPQTNHVESIARFERS
ncbi:MAG: 23S rRNA (uracil(1939)-C(5))-methyltransferase RlmD [Kiritimatiellaceae bacterium TMED266]|nr:MAG: 23S rRNA (uracil(1939)-C(5))-methyltransferase RlmD [Kiritimatiellaceae bacterium TMED266]